MNVQWKNRFKRQKFSLTLEPLNFMISTLLFGCIYFTQVSKEKSRVVFISHTLITHNATEQDNNHKFSAPGSHMEGKQC